MCVYVFANSTLLGLWGSDPLAHPTTSVTAWCKNQSTYEQKGTHNLRFSGSQFHQGAHPEAPQSWLSMYRHFKQAEQASPLQPSNHTCNTFKVHWQNCSKHQAQQPSKTDRWRYHSCKMRKHRWQQRIQISPLPAGCLNCSQLNPVVAHSSAPQSLCC